MQIQPTNFQLNSWNYLLTCEYTIFFVVGNNQHPNIHSHSQAKQQQMDHCAAEDSKVKSALD